MKSIKVFEYVFNDGVESICGSEYDGSILDYLKEMDGEMLDWYLNWNKNKNVEFKGEMVKGKNVVVLEGEEDIKVLGVDGEEFENVVGKVVLNNWNGIKKYVLG